MRLAEPYWLLLSLVAILPWAVPLYRQRLIWPTLSGFHGAPGGWAPARFLGPALQSLALLLLVAALARPQTVAGTQRIASRGVAIMVVLDRSSSMEAADFADSQGKPLTRQEAAKLTLDEFIRGRPDDLIGLVTFANYPDLASPPTLDHGFLRETAGAVLSASSPGEDGTNIGDAILWGLDALRKSSPARKVLVLLTDGENRPQGVAPAPIEPLEAARLAGELGVILHTVAVSRAGLAESQKEPITGLGFPMDNEGPDLQLLLEMAEITGGKSFVASNAAGLKDVFAAIDQLERSPLQGTLRTRYHEWFAIPLWGALACITAYLIASSSRLRKLP